MTGILSTPVTIQDHVLGPMDAFVTLVEYGDFECPACGQAYGIVKEMQRQLGERLLIVFRHFPLSDAHPHARLAAHAAEASAHQGRFWEMHDLLFENQRALEPVDLLSYAEMIGLDVNQFERDLASPQVAEHVRADFLSGVRSGVNGTPTFYINGHRYDGSWSPRSLLHALEAAFEEQVYPSL
jgi:protein-disulfide isomerase